MTASPVSESAAMVSVPAAHPRVLTFLRMVVLLVGLHSILLGAAICVFTRQFYALAFSIEVDNYFFVKQAGVFLLCLGMFYLFPLVDLKRYHPVIVPIVVTKVLAVAFILSNAQHTPEPGIIRLAGVLDGSMALLLACPYIVCRWRRLI